MNSLRPILESEELSEIRLKFEDTAVAFAYKNDWQLKRRYLILRLMSSPQLTHILSTTAKILLSLRLPIKELIRRSIFTEFCGGETFEDCTKTVKRLSDSRINSILDYSVEVQSGDLAFDTASKEVISSIERAKHSPDIPFAVFKVTAIARFELLTKLSDNEPLSKIEQLEWQRAKQRMLDICDHAVSATKGVLIDGEESWIQKAIDMVATELMEKYNRITPIVFNTIQLYRIGRLDFLKGAHDAALSRGYILGVKLVRGAYMEKERERASKLSYPSPIHPTKEHTDQAYNEALEYCIDNLERLALFIGSHNQESFELLVSLMQERKIPATHPHIVSAQLYGMGDNITYGLAINNYNVAKLVPYGPVRNAVPYLIRRAEENTSVFGQIGRELRLTKKEVHRRGLD